VSKRGGRALAVTIAGEHRVIVPLLRMPGNR
jgi:hypothetical protein